MTQDARRRASAAEAEIRSTLVDWLHTHLPDARLIHELPVGDARADLVAVLPARLVIFEIKSVRDTLDRLAYQLSHFHRVSQDVIVVADRKFFDTRPYANGQVRCAWPADAGPQPRSAWVYPNDDRAACSRWRLQSSWSQPAPPRVSAWSLLGLLSKDELLSVCRTNGIAATTRLRCPELQDRIVLDLSGRTIWRAVCGALRTRDCLEADPPIPTTTRSY